MKVVISLEQRFDRTPDGKVWTQTTCASPFWTRYLEVFDRVEALTIVQQSPFNIPIGIAKLMNIYSGNIKLQH
jgi:hypothetical protein